MDFNVAIIVGRLTKDPVLRITNSGKEVAEFTIANNLPNDEVEFVLTKAWGKDAVNIKRYVVKGNRILVVGTYRIDRYMKDGLEIKKRYLNASMIHFLDNGQTKSINKPEPSIEPIDENNIFTEDDVAQNLFSTTDSDSEKDIPF